MKVIPLERIDYCCACKKDHGFECPLDKTKCTCGNEMYFGECDLCGKPLSTEVVLKITELFHDTYETFAPAYGYETREDTKVFDPESKNGKLMMAVCGFVVKTLLKEERQRSIEMGRLSVLKDFDNMCKADGFIGFTEEEWSAVKKFFEFNKKVSGWDK
jgi:hypothetical protein